MVTAERRENLSPVARFGRWFCSKFKGKTPFDYFLILFFVVLAAITILPFLNIIAISFSGYAAVIKDTGMLWPKDFTVEAYAIIGSPDIYRSFGMTILYVVVGTVMHLVMCLITVYALSNKNLPGRKVMLIILLIPMLFGGGLIPLYLVIKSLGMLDSIWVFLIPGLVSPYNIILMKNFLLQVPDSLLEAARVDGAGHMTILFRIVAPLSKPILATLALFTGVGRWNDWFTAVMYINDTHLYPIQNVLRDITMGGSSLAPSIFTSSSYIADVSVQMAVTIIATIPIVLVYPFLQKYFVKGIFMGSVKA